MLQSTQNMLQTTNNCKQKPIYNNNLSEATKLENTLCNHHIEHSDLCVCASIHTYERERERERIREIICSGYYMHKHLLIQKRYLLISPWTKMRSCNSDEVHSLQATNCTPRFLLAFIAWCILFNFFLRWSIESPNYISGHQSSHRMCNKGDLA